MTSSKVGLLFSHFHVRENEKFKFDILEFNVDYFRSFERDFFIVLSGHGVRPPESLTNKIDKVHWQETIDNSQIGYGHPKFCIEGYKILLDNNIEKTIKLRGTDLIKNQELFYDLIEEDIVLTEQTCLQRRMIGDLLMIGSTKTMLIFWSIRPWDYTKSGLFNLFDNVEYIAKLEGLTVEEFLEKKATFVTPEKIGWYTFDNNWDLINKRTKGRFGEKHLWGAIPGYSYYGGF